MCVQVTKLIEESTVSKTVKNAIDTDRLLDWLVENSVLSIALEGKNTRSLSGVERYTEVTVRFIPRFRHHGSVQRREKQNKPGSSIRAH